MLPAGRRGSAAAGGGHGTVRGAGVGVLRGAGDGLYLLHLRRLGHPAEDAGAYDREGHGLRLHHLHVRPAPWADALWPVVRRLPGMGGAVGQRSRHIRAGGMLPEAVREMVKRPARVSVPRRSRYSMPSFRMMT